MHVDVAFLPAPLSGAERSVCIVIDVLRATSTLVTLAERGVSETIVVPDIEQAWTLRRTQTHSPASDEPLLLCGEVGGLPPPGFDFGNSPAEFSRLDLHNRRTVLFTSNGTKAMITCAASSGAVLAGALLNRSAVVRRALDLAMSGGLGITIVCSGTNLGSTYCLEDAFCAGALVQGCMALAGAHLQLGDGACTALRLFDSFSGDAPSAFATSTHGRQLAHLGFEEDLIFCGRTDVIDSVPVVERCGAYVVARSSARPA